MNSNERNIILNDTMRSDDDLKKQPFDTELVCENELGVELFRKSNKIDELQIQKTSYFSVFFLLIYLCLCFKCPSQYSN